MPVTVIVGGQYGGEGKGKITSHLSVRDDVRYVVRCGGPNSGHTVDIQGKRYQLRSLPAGFVNNHSRLLLAAGSLIDPRILLREIELCNVSHDRVGVDLNAGVISEREVAYERDLFLRETIGSTLSGTGAGVAARVLRQGDFKLAKDAPELRPFLTSVAEEVNAAIDDGQQVIVEGTQGFGLSLYHSDCYPYATSRDTTASAFLSEVGVSPFVVKSVIMAIRTYPIRVGGNSGPLKGEITWEELRCRSRYPHEIMEFTTATGRPRRVADFDMALVKKAAMVNRPTCIALHGADYLDYRNKSVTRFQELTGETKDFVASIETELGVPVGFVGTGPTNEELIDAPRHATSKNHPDASSFSLSGVGGVQIVRPPTSGT